MAPCPALDKTWSGLRAVLALILAAQVACAPVITERCRLEPREIERALDAHPEVFAGWATLLQEWPGRIDDGAHKAKVAMVVWDIAFLVVALHQAAGSLAEIAAAGRPPMPPLPAFTTAGGAAAASFTGPAAVEVAEALRKLIALGALDAGVVVALSRPLGGGAALSSPILPNAVQMSAKPEGGAGARTLQTGGNTIADGTAKALNEATGKNLSRRDWGRALEALKRGHGLPPGHHGKITSTGDYLDEAGNYIDNLLGYVP